MAVTIQKLNAEHRREVMAIFNHYVENGFAAYPENRLPDEFFNMFLNLAEKYPAVAAVDEDGKVAAFALCAPAIRWPPFSGPRKSAIRGSRPDRPGLGLDPAGFSGRRGPQEWEWTASWPTFRRSTRAASLSPGSRL
jgi:phosphinothricin acetyltransferase